MAYQGGDYAAPADFGDRKLSRLTVGTRKQRHHDRFGVRQLDHPRRRPPNVDLSPREYCARPSLALSKYTAIEQEHIPEFDRVAVAIASCLRVNFGAFFSALFGFLFETNLVRVRFR